MTPQRFGATGNNTLADAPGWQVRVVPNKYPALKTKATDGCKKWHL